MGVFILLIQGAVDCYHNGAFHTLAEKLAAVLINTGHRAGRMIGICGATARAIKSCPAVAAFGMCINIAGGKLALYFGIGNAAVYIA